MSSYAQNVWEPEDGGGENSEQLFGSMVWGAVRVGGQNQRRRCCVSVHRTLGEPESQFPSRQSKNIQSGSVVTWRQGSADMESLCSLKPTIVGFRTTIIGSFLPLITFWPLIS